MTEDTAITTEHAVALEAQERSDADYAHQVKEKLRNIAHQLTVWFFEVGFLLKEVRDRKLYRFDGYEGFLEYVRDDPDVAMEKSSAYRAIGCYETYVLDMKLGDDLSLLTGIDTRKLEMIRKVLTRENWQEWVERARTLKRRDLRIEVETERLRKRLAARGETVHTEPTSETPYPMARSFAAENEQLAKLCGDIIEDMFLTVDGLIIKGDSGGAIRVWAEGNELRVDVRPWEPPSQDEEVAEAAPAPPTAVPEPVPVEALSAGPRSPWVPTGGATEADEE